MEPGAACPKCGEGVLETLYACYCEALLPMHQPCGSCESNEYMCMECETEFSDDLELDFSEEGV